MKMLAGKLLHCHVYSLFWYDKKANGLETPHTSTEIDP
jgi:hypothetical protein